jgi:dTDP-glucose 4,6-dehydratase
MTDTSVPLHRPRSILLTGGAGFIGANLVHRLLDRDPDVRIVNLDLLTYAASVTHLEGLADPTRHQLVQGDIANGALVHALFREHAFDTVLHLAAESHVDRSIEAPATFIHSNVLGTCMLLEAARHAWLEQPRVPVEQCRFHHVSTDEVYGDLDLHDPGFTEQTPYAPSSPYSASKAASDHLVRAWHRTYGLPVTLSNCSNNYGPRQHAEKLIPTVIRKCLQRLTIPVYGAGANVRDWLHVEDHCDALWHIVRHGRTGETYNVGGNNEWKNLDLVRLLCRVTARVLDVPEAELLGLITFVTDRPGHDRRYAIDARKLAELGWSPTRSFEAGLEQTVRWYLARTGDVANLPQGRERLNETPVRA